MKRHLVQVYLATACLTTAEGFLSVLIAPYLDHLGYPVAVVGILVSIMSIAAFVARFPAGLLYSPRRLRQLMVGSLLAMSAATLLYSVSSSAATLGVARVLNGLGFGIAGTLIMAVLMDSIPPDTGTHRPMSLFGAAMALGFALGMGSGGVVADLIGFGHAFQLAALLPLAALALSLEPLRRVRHRGRDGGKPAPGLSWRDRLSRQARAFSHPNVASVALNAFLLNFLLEIGMTFFPLYGLAVGLSLTEVGMVRSVHSMAQIFSRIFAGELSARFGHRSLMTFSLVLLALANMAVPAFQSFVMLAALFMVIGTLRAIGFVTISISVAEDIPQQQMNRGMAATVFQSSKDVGNITGPLVGGVVAALVGLDRVFLIVPPAMLLLCLLAQQVLARARAESSPAPTAEVR